MCNAGENLHHFENETDKQISKLGITLNTFNTYCDVQDLMLQGKAQVVKNSKLQNLH